MMTQLEHSLSELVRSLEPKVETEVSFELLSSCYGNG